MGEVYDVLSGLTQDEWEDQQRQNKLEEDRLKIFESLEAIENDPYRTREDVASYIETKNLLAGDDRYEGLDAQQTLQTASALEDPNYLEPYQVTYGDAARYTRAQTAMMFTRNMPTFALMVVGADTDIGAILAKENPELFDTTTDEREAMGSKIKEQAFKEMFKISFPEMSEQDIENEYQKARSDSDYKLDLVLKRLKETRKQMDEAIKNNPKARAIQEWMSQDGFIAEGEYGKWAAQLYEQVAPSIMAAWLGGRGGGALGGTIGSYFGPWGTTVGTFSGALLGAGVTSGLMEGGSYLYEQWDALTQSEYIDKEQFEKDKAEARKYYSDKYGNKNVWDEDLKETMNVDSYLAKYLEQNYHQDEDGNTIRMGLTDEEALEAVKVSAYIYAISSGLIENISNLKLVGKLFPAKIRKQFNKLNDFNFFSSISKKMAQKAKYMGRKGAWNRSQKWFLETGFDNLLAMGAEGIEEMAQGFTSAMITAGRDTGGIDIPVERDLTFSGQHGGWTQVRDELAGGFFGSTPQAVFGGVSEVTGTAARIKNKKIQKIVETAKQLGKHYVVEKNEVGDLEIKGYEIEEDFEGNNIVTPIDVPVDSEGKTVETTFRRFDEAREAADFLEAQEKIKTEKIKGWTFREIANARADFVENEDGTFSIQTKNEEGEVLKTDTEKFKVTKMRDDLGNITSIHKPWKARRKLKEVKKQIELIDEYVSKYNLETKGEKDKIIIEHEEKKVKKIEKLREVFKEHQEKKQETDVAMGIAAFMGEEGLNEELKGDEEKTESHREALENNIITDANQIINIVKQDEGNEILEERGHDSQSLGKLFDSTFGPEGQNIPDFKQKRQELDKALKPPTTPPKPETPPTGVPISQDTGLPDIEKGPPEEGPPKPTKPPEQITFGFDEKKPSEVPEGAPTETAKAYAEYTDDELTSTIGEISEEIKTMKDGTSERKLADLRLAAIKKELNKRKKEKPIKKKKVIKTKFKQGRDPHPGEKFADDPGSLEELQATDPAGYIAHEISVMEWKLRNGRWRGEGQRDLLTNAIAELKAEKDILERGESDFLQEGEEMSPLIFRIEEIKKRSIQNLVDEKGEPREIILSEVPDHMPTGVSFHQDGSGAMVIQKSMFSGKKHQMWVPGLTLDLFEQWQDSEEPIQKFLPHLAPSEREFLLSGTTPAEWDAAFKEPDEDLDVMHKKTKLKPISSEYSKDYKGVIRKVKELVEKLWHTFDKKVDVEFIPLIGDLITVKGEEIGELAGPSVTLGVYNKKFAANNKLTYMPQLEGKLLTELPLGFYDPNRNKVVINLNHKKLGTDLAFHEFSHPFISMLAKNKPKLFNSLYQQAMRDNPALRREIEWEYKDEIKAGDMNEQDIMEEVIVFSIEAISDKSYQELEALSEDSKLGKLWKNIKRFFDYIQESLGLKKTIDGKVEVFGLITPNTTLQDISNYIVNKDNKYVISMDETAFIEEVKNIADDKADTVSHSFSLSDLSMFASEGEISSIYEDIQHEILLLPEVTATTLRDVLYRLDKIITKRYKLKHRPWKSRTIDKKKTKLLNLPKNITRKGFIESRKVQILEVVKTTMRRALPEGTDISDTIEAHLNSLAEGLEELQGKIEFRYALAENHLFKNPNQVFDIKGLDGLKDLKKSERKFIREFQKFWFSEKENPLFYKNKSLTGRELGKRYVDWGNEKIGLTAIQTDQYAGSLGYSSIDKSDTDNVYRMTIVQKHGYTMGHGFSALAGKTPIGWYTVAIKDDGTVLLHEFQSDAIVQMKEGLREINLMRDINLIQKGVKTPDDLIRVFLTDIETTIINQDIATAQEFNGDKDFLIPLNTGAMKVRFILKSDVLDALLKKHNIKKEGDLKRLFYIAGNFDVSPNGIMSMTKEVFTRLQKIIKLVNSLPEAENRQIISKNDLLTILDDLIGNFGKTVEPEAYYDLFDETTEEEHLESEIHHFAAELRVKLDYLKSQKYADFPMLSTSKMFSNILFNYGDSKASNQTRLDLREVFDWIEEYTSWLSSLKTESLSNEEFFINFPNKDNEIYKSLMLTDNAQRTKNYNKPRFKGLNGEENTFILSAYLAVNNQIDIAVGKDEPGVRQIFAQPSVTISYFIDKNGDFPTGNRVLRSVKTNDDGTPEVFTYKSRPIINKNGVIHPVLYQINSRNIKKLQKYHSKYQRERSILSIGQTLFDAMNEGLVPLTTKEKESFQKYTYSAWKYYLNEEVRKYSSRVVFADIGSEDVTTELNIEMMKDKLSSFKHASDMFFVADNSWFPTTIMHAIRHSHAKNSKADIYINTASAVALIENNNLAAGVYYNKRELQWYQLVRTSRFQFAKDFIKDDWEELVEYVYKSMIGYDTSMVQIPFKAEEFAISAESPIESVTYESYQVPGSNIIKDNMNSILEIIFARMTNLHSTELTQFTQERSTKAYFGVEEELGNAASKVHDLILYFLTTKSKNSASWNKLLNSKPIYPIGRWSAIRFDNEIRVETINGELKVDMNASSVPITVPKFEDLYKEFLIGKSTLLDKYRKELFDYIDSLVQESDKEIELGEKTINEAQAAYLKNKYNIQFKDVGISPFKKALNRIEQNKNLGVRFELVHPKWSKAPLYKVIITNEKKLIPLKFKKDLNRLEEAKDLPSSMESLEINLKNTIIVEEIDIRSKDYKVVKDFLDSAWRHMQRITGKKNIDIYEYKEMINNIIDENLVPAFEQWWEIKFEGQLERPDRVREIGKERYTFHEKLPDKEFVKEYDNWSEGTSVRQMLEKGIADERILTLNDLLYFKSLKKTITMDQLQTIAALANDKIRYPGYKKWKTFVLQHVLNVSFTLSAKQDRELHKYYNRVKSMVRINRDGDGSSNQRDSFIVRIISKKSKVDKKWYVDSIKIEKKGTVNIITNNKNNTYAKTTLFENNVRKGVFAFISGEDVVNRIYKGKKSSPRGPMPIYDWYKRYGFIQGKELVRVELYLRKLGYTIAFSRGDSDKIAIVRISDKSKENMTLDKAKLWWKTEMDRIARNPAEREQLEKEISELLKGEDIDRAANISVHNALTQVFPRYILDPKGGANVFKRLKIPFTPVTISDEMPPIRVDKFNPENVTFQVVDENGKPIEGYKEFKPMVTIDGVPTYVGDGNSITSQLLFDLFHTHHGLRKTTAKAKTVIYQKDGENVTAIKHQHVLGTRNLLIKSKITGEVIYSIDENRHIWDGDITKQHPTIEHIEGKKEFVPLNPVHMLVTSDEVKIGDMFETNNSMVIRGNSIGFIKYDEESKSSVKHIMQWYNYVKDPAVLNQFLKKYGTVLRDGVRDALSKAIIVKDGKPSIITDPKSIYEFVKKYAGRQDQGFAASALELAKLGAGIHPTMEDILDVLIQTQVMDPALNLSESDGSIYDVSMDMTGSLKENEVALGVQNSGPIKEIVALSMGKPVNELKMWEINDWLKENEVYVMVTRSPVAYIGGAYMARVARLHGRRSIADLNPFDVKEKLEADGDGDEVHIELLDEETMSIYKTYMDTIKSKPLNLNHFTSKIIRKITSTKARLDTITSLIAGSTAIAEIANVNAIYGMLYKTFNGFVHNGVKIKLREPTDKIKFGNRATYKGKVNGWEGTVEEYLRVWLQAAVDNNEFGLLYEWGYHETGQEGLIKELFETQLTPAQWKFIKPIVEYYKQVLSIKRGGTFRGKFRLTDTIKQSEDIYEYALDKTAFNLVQGNINIFTVDIKNKQLTPYELIAVAPYRVWQQMSKQLDLFGFDGSPYKLIGIAHKRAHKESRDYLLDNIEEIWDKAKEVDLESGRWDGMDAKQWVIQEIQKGKDYTKKMGIDFYEKLKKLKASGPQTVDRNEDFIEWKVDMDKEFKELSKVARVAATFSFLKGYKVMSRNLEKRALDTGSKAPRIIPPTSKTRGEISLLDSDIMRIYFREYNKYINSRNENTLTELLESGDKSVSLVKSAIRTCGG